MFKKLFKNSKRTFYISICIVAIISAVIFLLTIKTNNRKFNQNLLTDSMNLIGNKLQNLNKELNENSNFHEKWIYYNSKENKLFVNRNKLNKNEMNNLFDILNKFAVIEKVINNSTNSTYSPIVDKSSVKLFKHVNLFFLVHEEEDLKEYYKYKDLFKLIQKLTKIEVFIKFLFYDKFKGINSDNFYGDLKNYNPKFIFEELNDEDSLNLIILNDKNKLNHVDVYYNKDINNDIYVLNCDHLDKNNLIRSLSLKYLNPEIKNSLSDDTIILDEIIKINNCENVKFMNMLILALKNLEKLNKIFNLYESIRTIENVKEKYNSIQENLIELLKGDFNINQIDFVLKINVDTFYLMNSNELVSYEHYFSNEFKIGMFLPPMLPIVYGLIKAIKALTN